MDLNTTAPENGSPEDATLLENLRMIVGGVATLVAIVVPVILIRKLAKTIEESDRFKSLQNALS